LRPDVTLANLEQRQLLSVTDITTGQSFATIQAAVDGANAGDTLLADPGVYDEDVTVAKSLNIEGAEHGVDPGSRPGSVGSFVGTAAGAWNITAANVTIDGFNVVPGNATGPQPGPGIQLAPSTSGIRILNTEFSGYRVAISLASDGTSPDLIQHNLFVGQGNDNPAHGIGIEATGDAINATIDNNVFAGNADGAIKMVNGSAVESYITISNNQFVATERFQDGITLAGVDNVQIIGNTINSSVGPAINLAGNDMGVTINGNTIVGPQTGCVAVSNELATGTNRLVVIRFNLLRSFTGPGVTVADGAYTGVALDARDNWWGSNAGPDASGTLKPVGNVNATPWLVASLTVVPDSVLRTRPVTVIVDLTKDSTGGTLMFPPGHVPDGTPFQMFAHIGMFSDVGTFTNDIPLTVNGKATTTFRSTYPGTVTITTGLDHQSLAASYQAVDLSLSPPRLPDDTLGHPYHQTLSVDGVTGPIDYSVIAGGLPDGLVLGRTTGQITGTPTRAGSFAFTVGVSQNGLAPFVKRTYEVRINPAIAFETTSIPPAAVDIAYNEALKVGGGTGGLRFAITSGTLPAGLSLSPSGLISGTPTSAGASTFTVTAQDAVGASATQTYSLAVVFAPVVTNLQRFGFHAQPSTLVLTFSTALDPASAADLANYSLVQVVSAHAARPIALASATYDPAHHTVTLTGAGLIPLHARYRLTVTGTPPSGVRDTAGHFLAGSNGQSGTNYVHAFGREILAGPNRAGRSHSRPPTRTV
jgi:hypothetical protein